jgi:hypothetical protein
LWVVKQAAIFRICAAVPQSPFIKPKKKNEKINQNNSTAFLLGVMYDGEKEIDFRNKLPTLGSDLQLQMTLTF